MIDAFDTAARIWPSRTFLRYAWRNNAGESKTVSYTYREMRLLAAALARKLLSRGAQEGDVLLLSMANSPELVIAILAAGYAGFTLAFAPQGASEGASLAHSLELERDGMRIACKLDNASARKELPRIRQRFASEADAVSRVFASRRDRSIMGEQEDIVHDTVHFAERAAHLADTGTSGTSTVIFLGKPSVPLTKPQIAGAAKAFVKLIEDRPQSARQERLPFGESGPDSGCSVCQCAVPLAEIEGYQALVRTILQKGTLALYGQFDAESLLRDMKESEDTRAVVNAGQLEEMVTIDEWQADALGALRGGNSRLAGYSAVLLSDGTSDVNLLTRIVDSGADVYTCYGMAETAGPFAAGRIARDFRGGLVLAPGYQARIVDSLGADDSDFGKLVLRGPGVFDGYMNAKAPFTIDKWYITGDDAAIYKDLLYMRNSLPRTVVRESSARGESLEEAAAAAQTAEPAFGRQSSQELRRPSGSDFGQASGAGADAFADDAAFGDSGSSAIHTGVPGAGASAADPDTTAPIKPQGSQTMQGSAQNSAALQPGAQVDVREASQAREHAQGVIRISKIVVRRIRLSFAKPFQTARERYSERESLIVEVVDRDGRTGIGECSTLGAGFRNSETIQEDERLIRQLFGPVIVGSMFSHPREASQLLAQIPATGDNPLAAAAIETAIWDLYGCSVGRPLWQLLNDEYAYIWHTEGRGAEYQRLPRYAAVEGSQAAVLAGATIGLCSTAEAFREAKAAAEAGYKRVKLKIAPGTGLEAAGKIRRAFPELLLTLDANRSFDSSDLQELLEYDRLGVGWIEEPFGETDNPIEHAARMQSRFRTPLCLDESYTNAEEAMRILEYPQLRCIAMKTGKFGGIVPALRFLSAAKGSGRVAWMAGSYDTGINRRVSAAFETLPDMVVPGDVGSTSRYFSTDVTDPPYKAHAGIVLLNADGRGGLGCTLNEAVIKQLQTARSVVE